MHPIIHRITPRTLAASGSQMYYFDKLITSLNHKLNHTHIYELEFDCASPTLRFPHKFLFCVSNHKLLKQQRKEIIDNLR